MEKRKAVVNLILLVVLVVLIIIAVVFWNREREGGNNGETTEEEVKLRAIGYGSEISKLGFTSASAIVDAFISGYNQHSGEVVVSNIDFVGMYIYSDCDNPEKEFDDKYVEYMRTDSKIGSDEIILLQYTAKQQEDGLIANINTTNVELEKIEYTEIEDVSKYLSKFKAKIRTVSADEGIDQEDWVEFWLLHLDDAYYIIDYYNAGEDVG